MDIPRESGWRIKIEGDVNLNIDVDFPPELSQDQRVAQGLSTTAFHLVNAVPLVCEAANPGLKTYLDLPMIYFDFNAFIWSCNCVINICCS